MKREIQKILNATHDAMIAVDTDGIITLFNAAASRLTKIPSEEALGKPVDDVIDTTRLPLILQTGVSELNQQQPLGDITIVTNRMPVLDDDGQVIGAIAVFRDITEVLDLAGELTDVKETKSLLEAVFQATQDAISVVDEKGFGILINRAYTKLTGYTEGDVIGKHCTVDLAEGESVHLKVLESKKPVTGANLKVGPAKRDVVVDAAPILVGGKLRGSVAVIRDLTEINRLLNELDQAKAIIRNLEAKYTFDDIRGKSPIIINAIEKARMAAATPATVILRGESGTGKELFAHAIHNASARKYNRFIRVNCAAIAESLLESELFGYEEGAFTGASKGGKRGLFEQANGGTLFLDEIGEINMSTQAKLLRVLQEKEITRVGGAATIPVDVRILSATNLDLERAVKEGTFRQDLYYRLNVVPISIPPLRERKEDLDELVGYLVSKYNQEYGRSVEGVSPKAMLMIRAYDWPGNIRELENFIGRTMINMKMAETMVRPDHLPNLEEMKQTKEQVLLEAYDGLLPSLSLKSVTEHVEKTHIERVLALNEGNREQTARDLGISLRSLYYKMKKMHISE